MSNRGYKWQWGIDFDSRVNFAVRTLVEDGLHAGPLSGHMTWVGPLQRLGMNAEAWNDWVGRLVNDRASEPYGDPSWLWNGAEAVAEPLSRLWAAYEGEASRWRRTVYRELLALREMRKDDLRLLPDNETRAIAAEVPTLRLLFVEYIERAVMATPPRFLIVAGKPDTLSFEDLQKLTRTGLDELRQMLRSA